ncbi:MAG TPA: fasciclin domain-containing protein [Burkholderiaceae bacterium]|jgi:uncharacterized surface protein with fasciclin (FAS1) repeats|nr:fasciclin domain-containing protein [Burkholderiaceae bacterium]
MNKRSWLLATTAAAMLALAGCATTPAPTTIADTAARTPQLSTFNQLIIDAGLTDSLRAGGPYTVFAPSDEAFKAMPEKTLADLRQNKEQLKAVVNYHVLPAKMMAADVINTNAKTVQGANVALARAGSFVTVEDAVVTQADVAATNGVVHVIDRVLVPPKKH